MAKAFAAMGKVVVPIVLVGAMFLFLGPVIALLALILFAVIALGQGKPKSKE